MKLAVARRLIQIHRVVERYKLLDYVLGTDLHQRLGRHILPRIDVRGQRGQARIRLHGRSRVRDDVEIRHDIDDDALTRLRRDKLGFVFQAFHILPHLSIRQNVALPLWLQGRERKEADEPAQQLLDAVGLGERHASWPRELSGGEMQRVAIARALVHRPRLVLADEPTGNLDPANGARVLALLAERIRSAAAIGILVTHSREAAATADRVLHLTPDGLRG